MVLIPNNYQKSIKYYHGVLRYLENENFALNTIEFVCKNELELKKVYKAKEIMEKRREAMWGELALYSGYVTVSTLDRLKSNI